VRPCVCVCVSVCLCPCSESEVVSSSSSSSRKKTAGVHLARSKPCTTTTNASSLCVTSLHYHRTVGASAPHVRATMVSALQVVAVNSAAAAANNCKIATAAHSNRSCWRWRAWSAIQVWRRQQHMISHRKVSKAPCVDGWVTRMTCDDVGPVTFAHLVAQGAQASAHECTQP
jgi:hypothetical protein